MKFLNKLERLIRPFAIPNVTVGLIAVQVVVYFLGRTRPEFVERLSLDPNLIYQGEVWRIVSFLFVPPMGFVLLALIYWWVFYMMGSAVETTWGAARYNLYLLIGYLAVVVSALLLPGVTVATTQLAGMGVSSVLYATVFFAFAHEFPDFTFLAYFILPVKVRWLATLLWVVLGWSFFSSLIHGQWQTSVLVLATVTNFLLFFGPDLVHRLKGKQRRMAAKAQQVRAAATPRHTCTVCGVTNLDDRRVEFRYCSKCEGNLCYCMEHLADHQHVTAGSDQTQTTG